MKVKRTIFALRVHDIFMKEKKIHGEHCQVEVRSTDPSYLPHLPQVLPSLHQVVSRVARRQEPFNFDVTSFQGASACFFPSVTRSFDLSHHNHQTSSLLYFSIHSPQSVVTRHLATTCFKMRFGASITIAAAVAAHGVIAEEGFIGQER